MALKSIVYLSHCMRDTHMHVMLTKSIAPCLVYKYDEFCSRRYGTRIKDYTR